MFIIKTNKRFFFYKHKIWDDISHINIYQSKKIIAMEPFKRVLIFVLKMLIKKNVK